VKYTLKVCLALAAIPALVVAYGTASAVEEDEGYPLSLDQSLHLALENNLDLVSARMDPEISAEEVRVQDSAFDPTFTAELSTDEREQRPVDPTQPSQRTNVDYSAGVEQLFGFGASYSVEVFANDNDAPGFNFTNPFYTAGLNVTATMPLLNGFGKEPTQEALLLAQGNLDISRDELRRLAQMTIETVEGAYWDVLAAQEALRVSRQALERAEDLLDLNRKKVEVGTLAPIEITQAEAGVASQEEDVIRSETVVLNAEDELRRLLAVSRDDPVWERPILITDRPEFTPQDIDLDAAIAEALENRPEMATVRQTLRNLELQQRVARKNLKHGLDASVTFVPTGDNDESFISAGLDGIPGTGDDFIVPVVESKSDAFKEILDVENYFWRVGVTYTLPIGNKAAKARHRIAELNREKGSVDVQNQEQTVRVEVRSAVREVESGVKRVAAARKNVELQEKKLEAEQKKFENGMSTSFEVLTFQNDLADAELSMIQAGLDYARSLIAFERSKGVLLESRGLTLAE
jgi:outer membrane protein TolC